MVAIAFIVGVLVVGLVIYTATIERRREYGAVKAIGARNRTLYRVVTIQAVIAAIVGAIAGIGLAFAAGGALMSWRPQFLVTIEPTAVGIVLGSSLVMALLAALVPARSVARLEDGTFRDIVAMAADPVCGMAMERERAVSAERAGETFFFCSHGCREEFLGRLPTDGNANGRGLPDLVRATTDLVRHAHGR